MALRESASVSKAIAKGKVLPERVLKGKARSVKRPRISVDPESDVASLLAVARRGVHFDVVSWHCVVMCGIQRKSGESGAAFRPLATSGEGWPVTVRRALNDDRVVCTCLKFRTQSSGNVCLHTLLYPKLMPESVSGPPPTNSNDYFPTSSLGMPDG